jgi:hypothetical protein
MRARNRLMRVLEMLGAAQAAAIEQIVLEGASWGEGQQLEVGVG